MILLCYCCVMYSESNGSYTIFCFFSMLVFVPVYLLMFLYTSVLLMCFCVDRAWLCNVLVYLSVVDVFLCRQGVAV